MALLKWGKPHKMLRSPGKLKLWSDRTFGINGPPNCPYPRRKSRTQKGQVPCEKAPGFAFRPSGKPLGPIKLGRGRPPWSNVLKRPENPSLEKGIGNGSRPGRAKNLKERIWEFSVVIKIRELRCTNLSRVQCDKIGQIGEDGIGLMGTPYINPDVQACRFSSRCHSMCRNMSDGCNWFSNIQKSCWRSGYTFV